MMSIQHLLLVTYVAVLIAAGGEVFAAPPAAPATSASQAVSVGVVEARLKEVENSADYDDTTKQGLTDLYRKTLSSLESMTASQSAQKTFSQARQTAGDEAEQLRKKLDKRKQKKTPVTVNISNDTALNKIESLLLKEKADAAAIEAKLNSLEEQLDNETQRPDQARKSLTLAHQQQDSVNAELKKPSPKGELEVLREARQWRLQAQLQALNAKINMLDQELLSQPMRLKLLKVQRDTTTLNLAHVKERTKILEGHLNEQRRSDVERVLAETATSSDLIIDKHPVVQALIQKNTQSSNQLTQLSQRLEQVTNGDQAADDDAKLIEDEYRRTQKKLDVAGLSQALGQILLEQRRLLPDVRQIKRDARNRENLIAETALYQIQVKEELRSLRNLQEYVDNLASNMTPEEVLASRSDLLELATARRNLLEKTATLGDAFLRALGELDYAQRHLINTLNQYNSFLSERLLWVRSSPAPSIALLLATPAQVLDILSPVNWYNTLKVLSRQLTASAWPLLILATSIILLWKKRVLKQRLLVSAHFIIKPRLDKFRYSLEALGLTLLIALPWPLLVWMFGWSMSTSLEIDAFTKGLAHAFMVLSPAFFYLGAFRVLCIPGGLADKHFRWPQVSLQPLRKQLSILMATFLPAGVVAVTSIHYGSQIEGALARITFIVVMGAMSWFFYRLFGPKQPVLAAEFDRHPDSLLTRFRYLWMGLALVIPLLLVVLAIGGFLYTAAALTGSLIDTLWLALSFLVIHQMGVRWLLLLQRKLAFQAALERRRAAMETAASQENSEDVHHDETELEEPEVDLVALNHESLKLLDTAVVVSAVISLWFIWSDVLPAFSGLEKFALWHYTGVVDGATSLIPVTLADVILALIIGFITLVAARRFPALLEIILLKRATSGSRYTVTTLSRYAIAAVGSLLVLSTIGAKWSQVQWLAAALSVGIGFGLQEIVANFISGLIILFERPIRVGDVVTVGDTDGTVTRIQIRATTIRTWDRQELLVPNKEFITGRLLNWSLSDQTTRIRIPVGVAYGSDVERARSLMLSVAVKNTLVLSDPAPNTIFSAFGDNTLNLELRCFVGVQEHRLQAVTQLHEAINAKFNECGIVIAFPQRDVHLDTSQPLDVRIHPVSNT